jgi:hypothetical protein
MLATALSDAPSPFTRSGRPCALRSTRSSSAAIGVTATLNVHCRRTRAASAPAQVATDQAVAVSDRIAGSGRLTRDVHWVASEVPATPTRGAMRHPTAAALACLRAVCRGVRASPVLTLPATCLAYGDARRAGCRSGHRDTTCRDVLRPTRVSLHASAHRPQRLSTTLRSIRRVSFLWRRRRRAQ